MRTNIDINDDLMDKAMKISKLNTKKQVVEAGLKELIRMHAVKELMELRGKVEFFDNYEPRTEG